jgi:hypothetical protein
MDEWENPANIIDDYHIFCISLSVVISLPLLYPFFAKKWVTYREMGDISGNEYK